MSGSVPSATRLPTFLIIGAPRAGTTSLYHWLRQHPDVFMPEFKEPSYFAFEDGSAPDRVPSADFYVRDRSVYEALFREAGGARAVGEASTLYLQCPQSPERIRERLGEAVRLIAILRDPAERAFSHYLLHRGSASEPLPTFRQALDAERSRSAAGWRANWNYREPGFYARHIERYRRVFDPEQIKLLFFEDLCNDPESAVRAVARFIGVDDQFPFDTAEAFNVSIGPATGALSAIRQNVVRTLGATARLVPAGVRQTIARRINAPRVERPPLLPEDRALLVAEYRSDIAALQQITGRDLSHWLR